MAPRGVAKPPNRFPVNIPGTTFSILLISSEINPRDNINIPYENIRRAFLMFKDNVLQLVVPVMLRPGTRVKATYITFEFRTCTEIMM